MSMKKKSMAGIITCMLYFLSVGLFLITKSDAALTIWELMTVISGPVVLVVLIRLSEFVSTPATYQKAMVAFMGCACALTATAHIVNITVTRALMQEGVNVPTYFQIGYWPSIEMAVDYLAWGLFVGLSFLCISIPIKYADREKQRMKVISLICSVLCIAGFIGAIFVNENIWYLAPMGYGIGLLILCLRMFKASN